MDQQRKIIITGTEDYEEIVTNNCYFVDKTMFIKNWLTDGMGKVLLLSRPRRFGKTLTMSMLYHFLSINHKNPLDISKAQVLFKDTKIFQESEFCKKHMGQYPVVYLSLKEIDGLNFNAVYKQLACLLSSQYAKFDFLLQSDKLSEQDKISFCIMRNENSLLSQNIDKSIIYVRSALAKLTEYLCKHYEKKAIVLIDEYDVPLAKASVRGYYEQMVDLIRGILGSVLKTNSYLERAVLTGCLRVSKESIFTGLNNLSVSTVFDTNDKLATAIGFTLKETEEMLEYYGLSQYRTLVKEWYDGYNFANHEMFCSWDVVNFCDYARWINGKSKIVGRNFWINTSGNDIINQFLGFLSEKDAEEMQILVDGGFISKKLRETLNYEDLKAHLSDDFWSMLLYTGYLTVAGKSDFDVASSELNLRIPNRSIRSCFIEKIQNYFTEAPTQIQKASKILQSIFSGNARQLRLDINNALEKFISFRDISTNAPKEYYYHGFLNGVFSTQSKLIRNYASNKEAGNGYSDITFLSRDSLLGIVLELKYTDDENALIPTAKTALNQIEEKSYVDTFKLNGFTEKVFAFGISFNKKSCAVVLKEYAIDTNSQ